MSDAEIKAQVSKFKTTVRSLQTQVDTALAFKQLKAENAPLWMLHMVSLRHKELDLHKV